jgi:acyl-coenzyme A synthetase/AMP-(fatty) acid ligase
MQTIPEGAWQAGAGTVDDALVHTPLLALFEAAARRDPQAPAVVDPARVLTYRQLWNAAIALADSIADATRPGDRVGVRLPAGVEHAVAILACLAAGRVVVPLDTADPPARTGEIVGAAGIVLAFGEANLDDGTLRWRKVDRLDTAGPMRPAPSATIPPDAPAFIVATSGSSGVPKLIVHSQRSQATLVHGSVALQQLTSADRTAFTGSSSSAAIIQYLFQSLVSGGAALFCDIRSQGLNRFMDLLVEHRATTMRVFPSLVRVLAALPQARAAFAHLRLVGVIGEPMLAADFALLRGVLPPGAVIGNAYGASETIGFDWFAPPGDYSGGTVVPSGKARAGIAFVLVDADGAPCPHGAAGELLIRSRYNAIGEWRDGRCVPGRMEDAGQADGSKLYRTGDLGVIGPDGMLTILGRADRQVKVNGNRIELAEIEAAMRAIPGIAAAAVVARRDGGRTLLLGFFVGAPDVVSAADVRRALVLRLPPAMLPAQLIRLDSLPFLPGFKLDTAALLAHAASGSG